MTRSGHPRVWALVAFLWTVTASGLALANDPPKDAHGGDKKGEPVQETGPFFFPIPDLLVNLKSSTPRPVFLKISLSVEAATGEDKANALHNMPFILDGLQVYLRELRPEDVRGSSGMYKLRQDLLRRISLAVFPARVIDVLFKEMLVQ